MAVREKPPEQAQGRSVVFQNKDGGPVIYTNVVEVTSGPFDFRFRFGRVLEADESSLKIEEVANVYMSPEHAKSLLQVLATRIKDHFAETRAASDTETKLDA